ncbi:MAG: hypothetical protein JNK10_06925 [Cyclobacteriaceae bacterium]|nr:hypothetical protein [Cyclobacteriaceae bacterium]
MKTMIRFTGIFCTLTVMLTACSGNKENSDSAAWPELDAFHEIMADSFHPLKDENTLEPAKQKAEAMAQLAEKWAESDLPAKVANYNMKGMLRNLEINTRTFANSVAAGASDEELAKALTSLHDEFHRIQEAWAGSSGEHH